MKNLLLLTLLIPCIAFSQSSADGDGSCSVDVRDFNAWNENAFTVLSPEDHPMRNGDYNLDGLVDGSDFNIWNANKFENITTNKIQIDVIGTNLETDIPVRIMSKLNGTTPVEFPFANTLHLASSPSSDITAEVTTGNSYFTCLDGQNGSLILKAQASDDFDNPTVMYEAMSDSASSAMVLTNGMNIDEVNHLFGVSNDTAPQQRLRDVVTPYLNSNSEISIPNNQVIVAFELNDDPKDFNDLVVMVTLGEEMRFDYDELRWYVGDHIGTGGIAAGDHLYNAGTWRISEALDEHVGVVYTSDGKTPTDIRALLGATNNVTPFDGINFQSHSYKIQIYKYNDYFANSQTPDYEYILPEPYNFTAYEFKFDGLYPAIPEYGFSGPDWPSSEQNRAIFDHRFSLVDLITSPLPQGDYVITFAYNHVPVGVGLSFVNLSQTPSGSGPMMTFTSASVSRRLAHPQDIVRFALGLVEKETKTFQSPSASIVSNKLKNKISKKEKWKSLTIRRSSK